MAMPSKSKKKNVVVVSMMRVQTGREKAAHDEPLSPELSSHQSQNSVLTTSSPGTGLKFLDMKTNSDETKRTY
jgi:hypothetical protein